MPAVSKKQQESAAIAEHNPDKLNASNRGMLKMSKQQLHDYASTPRKGLPDSTRKTQHTGFRSVMRATGKR